MEFHLIHRLFKPVKDNQFAGVQLVYHKTAHIGVILHKCRCIRKEHFLINCPVIRHILEQLRQLPHAVVFQHNSGCAAFLQERFQMLRIQFLRFFNGVDIDVLAGHCGDIIFLLALFAQEQHGLFSGIKAFVLQGLLNKLGLSGL